MTAKVEEPIVTAGTKVVGGVIIQMSDDEWSLVPWHIDFEVHNLPWIVEGVIYTETAEGSDHLPVFESISIRRRKGGPPIASDMIRSVPLKEIRRKAIGQVSVAYRREGDVLIAEEGARVHGMTASRATSTRGTRAKIEDLQEVVEAYRKAKHEGRTDLQNAVGGSLGLSVPTVSRRLARARHIGLLGVDE